MAYTLEHNGVEKTLAEWGADDSSSLTLQNQAAGTLTLHFPGWMDADVVFGFRDKVILRLNGVVVWRGHADAPQRAADGNVEGITMVFFDAWWFLSNGVLAQTIYDGSQGAATRTGTLTNGTADVTLASTAGLAVGMTVAGTGVPAATTIASIGTGMMTMSAAATADGDEELRFIGSQSSNTYGLFAAIILGSGIARLSVRTTIQTIIAACDVHHGGGVISLGACEGPGFSVLPMPVDVKGTFETGLATAVKFAPDAVAWGSFAADPMQLNFTQRVSAEVKTLPFADGRVMISQEFKARPDLQVTGVLILYRYFRVLDGGAATFLDGAGASSGPGVLYLEFDLRPPTTPAKEVKAVVERQWLESEPVDETSKEWWFKHGNLGVLSEDDIEIVAVTPEGGGSSESSAKIELDPDAPENAEAEDLTDVSGCTRVIVSGGIPSWLNVNAHVRYIRVSALLKFRVFNDPEKTDPSKDAYIDTVQRVELNYAATDLATGWFENEVSAAYTDGGSRDGETPPTGLAAQILAALNTLQYAGSVTLTNDECDWSFHPGQVLDIPGSARAEWDTMHAQIQGVTHVLHTGTTILTCGPAEHLAPQDFIEILRSFEGLKPATDIAERADEPATPEEVGGGTVNHTIVGPRSSSTRVDNIARRQDSVTEGGVTGNITTDTQLGKQVLTDGTTRIEYSAAAKEIKITDGSKSITIGLASLPAGADMRARELPYCDGSGESMTAWFICTEPS